MGFLSFLAKKPPSDSLPRGHSIKSQAYDATAPSQAPIRGTYPVPGNGPNFLDRLHQSVKKRSEAQLSLFDIDRDPHPNPHPAAPAPPPASRFRNLLALRPNSAPTNPVPAKPRQPIYIGPKKYQTEVPAVSNDDDEELSEYEDEDALDEVPPVPPIARGHRYRRSSLDSLSTTRFVDILDAQGEIKPSNFRSRVAASGVRDFGEDVAERNIGENGVDLNSGAVQAFYALFRSQEGYTGRVDAQGNAFYSDDDDEVLVDPELLRQAARASRELSREDREARRRSFNTFTTPPVVERQRPRPLSLLPPAPNFVERRPGSRSRSRSRPRTTGSAVERGRRTDDEEAEIEDSAPSPRIRGRTLSPKYGTNAHYERPTVDWQHSLRQARGAHSQPLSRPSTASSVEHLSYGRTRSIGGVSSATARTRLDDISEHIPVRTSSLAQCLTPTTMSSGYSSNIYMRPRSHHTANTSIDASVPTSSVKRMHIRDFSDSMSGVEHRTSAYYSPGDDESVFPGTDVLSYRGEVRGQDDQSTPRPDLGGESRMDDVMYNSYDSDDSDADSFLASQQRRKGGEENLLLNQGFYGDFGRGLPGLFDALPSRKSPDESVMIGKPTLRAHSSMETTERRRANPRLRRSKAQTLRSPMHRMSLAQRDSFSEDEGAQDPRAVLERLEFEYLRAAGLLRLTDLGLEISRSRMAMRVMEADPEGEDDEYDKYEDDNYDDVISRETVAKLRHMRKRLSNVPAGRSRHHQQPAGSIRRIQDDDEGDAADDEI